MRSSAGPCSTLSIRHRPAASMGVSRVVEAIYEAALPFAEDPRLILDPREQLGELLPVVLPAPDRRPDRSACAPGSGWPSGPGGGSGGTRGRRGSNRARSRRPAAVRRPRGRRPPPRRRPRGTRATAAGPCASGPSADGTRRIARRCDRSGGPTGPRRNWPSSTTGPRRAGRGGNGSRRPGEHQSDQPEVEVVLGHLVDHARRAAAVELAEPLLVPAGQLGDGRRASGAAVLRLGRGRSRRTSSSKLSRASEISPAPKTSGWLARICSISVVPERGRPMTKTGRGVSSPAPARRSERSG